MADQQRSVPIHRPKKSITFSKQDSIEHAEVDEESPRTSPRLTPSWQLRGWSTFHSSSSANSPNSRPPRHQSFKSDDGPGPRGLTCVYSPPEPLVDLIFVHGLHGGAYKTWRKENQAGSFWPGEWLPKDPNFESAVRIHTFGYKSDWSAFQSSQLGMNDFASYLHGEMVGSEELCRGEKTPIILVGHSMGGLVIKKACLQFCNENNANVDHSGLATRIKCLMFLATPHHGSDQANRLDRILRSGLSPLGSKTFVGELKSASLTNETINSDFKYIAPNYLLYSFYENRALPPLGYVVEKNNAVINGPKNENVQMLEGDHRSICKFENGLDSNYKTIRNHLARVVDQLLQLDAGPPELEDIQPVGAYLGCEGMQEDELEAIRESKIVGTCRWIEKSSDFATWRRGLGPPVWLYWLNAAAGSGKSVISSHVNQILGESDVSYFFFVDGTLHQRTVAELLRSLAFQLAQRHRIIRDTIQKMQHDSILLDEDDEKSIWKKLFVNCIFRVVLERPQYWIIDALDECHDAKKLFPLLRTMHPAFIIRVFITSRPTATLKRHFSELKATDVELTEHSISPEETVNDIRALLDTNKASIKVKDEKERSELIDNIVANSHGSFLWVDIVMKEIQTVWTKEQRNIVLEQIPEKMKLHYDRILGQMIDNAQGKHEQLLIRTTLTWVVCGIRHLSTEELEIALANHSNIKMERSMKEVVEGLCGQLLRIDKRNSVHLIHTTVRDFLFKSADPRYRIARDSSNLGMAKTCLQYLLSDEMKVQGRLRRRLSLSTNGKNAKNKITDRTSAFAEYASSAFSVHLVNGPLNDEEVFELLDKFLTSQNVLCWIEYVAERFKRLDYVKDAGANLRRVLEKRSKYLTVIGPQLERDVRTERVALFDRLSAWSVDLIRLVSKFGRNILESPVQIHNLVPPFCPKQSLIHAQFHDINPNLEVVGIKVEGWADAISYIEHLESRPTSIASSDRYLAIGYSSRKIHIFDPDTCQELLSFDHGSTPRKMLFDNSGVHLAAAGRDAIKLWNLEKSSLPTLVWTQSISDSCIGFYFSSDDEHLIVATKGNQILSFQTSTTKMISESGEVHIHVDPENDEDDEDDEAPDGQADEQDFDSESDFPDEPDNYPDESVGEIRSVPTCASFSPDGQIVCFAYPGESLCFRSVKHGNILDFYSQDSPVGGSLTAESILFNPNTDLQLLVVKYHDGGLSLINCDTLKEVKSVEAQSVALSATQDGRTLATGDAKGGIQLWDFVTLTPLYKINYNSHSVRDLAFRKDGLRLFDIRETHSVVWEPAALIRENDEEEERSSNSSKSGASVILSTGEMTEVTEYEDPNEITSLALHNNCDYAFVGLGEGTVDLYDLKMGSYVKTLYDFKSKAEVTHIAFNGSSWLASANSNSAVILTKLTTPESKQYHTVEAVNSTLVRHNLTGTDGQILRDLIFSASGHRLMIIAPNVAQIWKLSDSGSTWEFFETKNTPKNDCWKFFPSLTDNESHQFQLIEDKIDDWLPEELKPKRLLRRQTDGEMPIFDNGHDRIRNIVTDASKKYIALEYEGAKSATHLIILRRGGTGRGTADHGALPQEQNAGSLPGYTLLHYLRPNQVKMFLGFYDGRAVYLGPHLWIRTANLEGSGQGNKCFFKHFFIPHEYIGGNHCIQAMVGHSGEVVFPRRGMLVVVRGGISLQKKPPTKETSIHQRKETPGSASEQTAPAASINSPNSAMKPPTKEIVTYHQKETSDSAPEQTVSAVSFTTPDSIMTLIQKSILRAIGASTDFSEANFLVKCNLREYIKEQYGSSPQDIRHILTITGNRHDAQMTTVDDYMKQTWPANPSTLVDQLQLSISGVSAKEQNTGPSQPRENFIKVLHLTDTVSVSATGSAEFLCTIGQQLAWLGAVCRSSGNGLGYCNTVWTDKRSGAHPGGDHFAISYDVVSFDSDGTKPCWHSLVGDFVVATSFPVPERSYDDKGLQIPVEVMAALGGASIAVDIGSGFFLKGETIALIPVERRGDRVQWHLVERGGEIIDYDYIKHGDFKQLSRSVLDGKAINSTTAFLGWTPHVVNIVATDEIDCSRIRCSGSCETPEIAISPSGGSLSISKIVGLGLSFRIGRKQTSPSIRPIKEYHDILHDLRDRHVIFYDTATRRGWLIDAERATLQILLHRSKTRSNYCSSNGIFGIADPMDVFSAQSAMESNQQVILREGWDAAEGRRMDVWFSAVVSEVLETLRVLAYKTKSEYRRCFQLANLNVGNRSVVGFEYMGLVGSSTEVEHHAMKVKLDTDCGAWPNLANDLGAVILLAKNFQEVLSPRDKESLCPNFQKLPVEKSYLATEVITIRKLFKRFNTESAQNRLTATNMTWIVSENVFTPCDQQNGATCSCRRVQELSRTCRSQSPTSGVPWDHGAIIFGAKVTNCLQKERRETSKRTFLQSTRGYFLSHDGNRKDNI